MKRALTRDNALVALIVIPPLLLLFWVRQHIVDIPFWDEWDETGIVLAFHRGTLTFADLWAQHSEHRILTMRLTLIGLDALLHHWDPVSEIFLSIAAAIATLAGLIVLAFRSVSPSRALLLGVVFSLLVFSIAQYENWTWGFEIAWFYVNASLVWSIVLLSARSRRWMAFAGATMLAAFATVSMATGPLVWLTGAILIASVPNRDRLSRFAAWLALGAIVCWFYVSGFVSPGSSGLFAPATSLVYAVSYLGIELGGWLGFPGTTIVGAAAIGGVILAVIAIRRDADRERAARAIPWLALASFALAGATLTALGRASHEADSVFSPRYVTVSQNVWIALAGLAMMYAPPIERRARIVLFSVGIGVCTGAFAIQQWRMFPNMVTLAWRMDDVRERLIAGTASDAVLREIYPNPDVLRRYVTELRAVREGPLAAGS